MQKLNFMPPFFLEILQKYCKDYGHQKQWYMLQGNFDSYLHEKNEIYVLPLSSQDFVTLLLWVL